MGNPRIQINYQGLDDIVAALGKYEAAYTTLQEELARQRTFLNTQKGAAIISILNYLGKIDKEAVRRKEFAGKLKAAVAEYKKDLNTYVQPKSYKQDIIVDSRNIETRIGWIKDDASKAYSVGATVHTGNVRAQNRYRTPTDDKAVIDKQNRNQKKIESIHSQFGATAKREVDLLMKEMYDVHKKQIAKFKEMDRKHKEKILSLYKKYLEKDGPKTTSPAEQFGKGVLTDLKDTLKGLYDLAALLPQAQWSIATANIMAEGFDFPDWMKEFIKPPTMRERAEGIKNLLMDPFRVIDTIRDNVADTYEREGLAYTLGVVVFEAATLLIPVGAAAKAGKVGTVVKAGEAAKLSEVGKAAEAAESINAAEEAAKATSKILSAEARGVDVEGMNKVIDSILAWRDKLSPQQIKKLLQLSGHNPDSKVAVIGRHNKTANSYEQFAYRNRYSYFDMGDAFNRLKKKIPTAPQKMNDIWLDRQIADGKDFVSTSNPHTLDKNSYFYTEIEEIKKTKLYKIPDKPGSDGCWHITRIR